jgi:uncharacterized protein
MKRQKNFVDGVDLNTVFPGKLNGNESDTYAYNLFHKGILLVHTHVVVFTKIEYLIDLHTLEAGRVLFLSLICLVNLLSC